MAAVTNTLIARSRRGAPLTAARALVPSRL